MDMTNINESGMGIMESSIPYSSQFQSQDESISSGQPDRGPIMPHCSRQRAPVVPPTGEEISAMRQMLVVLEKYVYVWRNEKVKKGPTPTNSVEWQMIAEAVTGNGDDDAKMKKWFKNIKKQIRYRLNQAIRKGIITPENLEAEKDDRLKIMYDQQPYKFWTEAEYLTKYLICEHKELQVDIDGIYTQHVPDGEGGISQRASSSRKAAEYNALLSGVSGFQESMPCGALPPMQRRCIAEFEMENEEVFGGATSQESCHGQMGGPGQCKSIYSAAAIVENQMDVTPGPTELAMIKQEPEEPEEPEYQHGVLSLLEQERIQQTIDSPSYIQEFKREPDCHSQPKGNPLQYLFDPKNPHHQRYPTPRGEAFGISQEDLEGRIEGFKSFQVFLEEKVMRRSAADQMKFFRLFSTVASYVSACSNENPCTSGMPPMSEREIDNIIQNFKF